MPAESASIKAIKAVRNVFEYIHGNLGVLKFNVDELTPTNGSNGQESKKWRVVCSFYESLGASAPSKYEANVDLNDNTVTIKKLGEPTAPVQRYKVTPEPEPSTTPPTTPST